MHKMKCDNCKMHKQDVSTTTGLCVECTDALAITKEIVTSEVSAEFGTALVKAGQDARQKKLTEQCVSTVEQILSQINTIEANIKIQTKQLEVYRKRLQAIEKGKIEIVPNGNNVRIKYKDKDLDPEVLNY